jgi:hypothetical protein
MSTPPPKPKSAEEKIADLRVVIDNMATSMATMQGNHDQLTVAVNRLQSEKIIIGDNKQQTSHDPVVSAARHGHKLMFPTFDGIEDPLPWLNRCEQFFRVQSIEDMGKVFLASFYMTGDAALVERNRGTPTWPEFVKLVNQHFGPPLCGNAVGELIQLKRDSTVTDYQSRFLALVNRCTSLIQNPLKTDVELEHPENLEDAMALARAYEQRLGMTDNALGRTPGRYAPWAAAGPKPLALLAPPATTPTGAPTTTPLFKCLTSVEMAVKRARAECYNCIEIFSPEHLKACPDKGVFLIQMEEEPTIDQLDEFSLDEFSPLISLNAITKIAAVETMRLAVQVDTTTLTALVDSGSTRSFLSIEVASRLHLLPIHQSGL